MTLLARAKATRTKRDYILDMDTATFAPRLAARLAPGDNAGESADFLLALLHRLVAGQPVAPATLAGTLGWTEGQMAAAMARAAGMERDAHGAITGYALTLNETPYRFITSGRTLYGWCAFDTLFFPPLLDCSARVRSVCAQSGAPIALSVAPDAIHDLQPAGAAISILLPGEADDIRTGFCCRVRFFASMALGRKWAAAHPEIEVMPVTDVFALARASAEWIWARAKSPAVLQDQASFGLDTDQFKQFTRMLDAPPEPNAGLERLMAVKAPWRTGVA